MMGIDGDHHVFQTTGNLINYLYQNVYAMCCSIHEYIQSSQRFLSFCASLNMQPGIFWSLLQY